MIIIVFIFKHEWESTIIIQSNMIYFQNVLYIYTYEAMITVNASGVSQTL